MRLLGRHAGVALDHAVLHFDRASHRVDDAAKLDEAAVAGALDDAPMMHGDRRDQSDRCAARAAAPAFDLRPRQRAGYSRQHPTTRIAAIFRVSLMARPPGSMRLSTKAVKALVIC